MSPFHGGVPRSRPGSGCSCRSSFVRVGFVLVFGVCGWFSRFALRCSDKNAGDLGQGLGRSCFSSFLLSSSQDQNGGDLGQCRMRSYFGCVSLVRFFRAGVLKVAVFGWV